MRGFENIKPDENGIRKNILNIFQKDNWHTCSLDIIIL